MKIITVIGTRPEAIKMAPIIKALNKDSSFEHILCVSSQHEHMLNQVLILFDIKPDIEIKPDVNERTLAGFFSYLLSNLDKVLSKENPDAVMVHGDTSTTLASALAAYYHRKPVIHIEAGLRTNNIYSPWPEEINRKMTAAVTNWHFAPTDMAKENLISEGYDKENIWVVGNSVIDALLLIVKKLDTENDLKKHCREKFNFLNNEKKLILVTGHRRENFGQGFENICKAIASIADRNDVEILYPVHLNPTVQEQVKKLLSNNKNIHLIDPVNYLEMIYLMQTSYLILTDSGGIQEEAPALGKPVLVMRETTERPEATKTGVAKLVGTQKDKISSEINLLLDNKEKYKKIANIKNPFGEGDTSHKIVSVLKQDFSN